MDDPDSPTGVGCKHCDAVGTGCLRCDGTGEIGDGIECGACEGEGIVEEGCSRDRLIEKYFSPPDSRANQLAKKMQAGDLTAFERAEFIECLECFLPEDAVRDLMAMFEERYPTTSTSVAPG
jgi:hypothetical protein